MSPRLATTLLGIPMRTPILAASGTYAYGVELRDVADVRNVGAIITKGLSKNPMDGNPAPRLFETESGMMNSIGLQNVGVKAFIAEKLPGARTLGPPIIANVFGYAVEDYAEVIMALEDAEGIAAYELNVSCPNTAHGGMFFSNDPTLLAEVVGAARKVAKRPLIVKLSPNVARIEPVAQAAVEAGADAISLVNTFVALAIDPRTRKPRLGNGFGGLSGPAIKPIALRMVYEAAKAVKVPVIGLGGIATGEDAAEFLIAGASAVEVGTASFWDPQSPARIARELDVFLAKEKIARAQDLIGTVDFSKE
jgi:dihydroorotate dehydrogenase (NAD+) catalytic subunit